MLRMRNRQKEILSAKLWWLEQRRSFQGQDREDGRQVLPSALVPYTKCSGPDTPVCWMQSSTQGARLQMVVNMNKARQASANFSGLPQMSTWGWMAVVILRLQPKIYLKSTNVSWLFHLHFPGHLCFASTVKIHCMHLRFWKMMKRNPRKDFFIKGELIFQWYFYLYVFISTAFRKCLLEPPWKKMESYRTSQKSKDPIWNMIQRAD